MEGGTLPVTGKEGEAVMIIKRREVAEDYGAAKAICFLEREILASPKRLFFSFHTNVET